MKCKAAVVIQASTGSCTAGPWIFEQIELQAKLLNYFLGSNKSNINQWANIVLLLFVMVH